jgi:hypothetical protein
MVLTSQGWFLIDSPRSGRIWMASQWEEQGCFQWNSVTLHQEQKPTCKNNWTHSHKLNHKYNSIYRITCCLMNKQFQYNNECIIKMLCLPVNIFFFFFLVNFYLIYFLNNTFKFKKKKKSIKQIKYRLTQQQSYIYIF